MLKISNAVRTIVESEPDLKKPLKQGLINFSAYAKKIKEAVEKLTKKPVSIRTIVVALSRLVKTLPQITEEKELKVLRMSVYTDLEELSYEKTRENIKKLEEIYHQLPKNEQDFFALTQSVTEITMVAEQKIASLLKAKFGSHFLFNKKNLNGIALKFPLSYLNRPDVLYGFIKKIAGANINIIEVISSSSELTFIVEQKNTAEVIKQLAPA